jgi:hypothetical protein
MFKYSFELRYRCAASLARAPRQRLADFLLPGAKAW